MSESDIIQKQRQIFRDFRLASSRRVNVESEAKKQFEEQRKEAEQFLDGQKQRRLQMEAEAKKRFDTQRKAAESEMVQAKGQATTLLKRAQTALQEAQDALVNFPHPIVFKAKTIPNHDVASVPEIELQQSVHNAEEKAKFIRETVFSWQEQRSRGENVKYLLMFGIIFFIIFFFFAILVILNSTK